MRVSIDLETYPIDRCQLAPKIVCAGFAWDDVGSGVQLWKHCKDKAIEQLQSETVIGAHFAFDAACIMADDPDTIPIVLQAYREGRIADVLLQEKMIDIALGTEHDSYSLAAVAQRRLDVTMDKDTTWRTEFRALESVPVSDWPKSAIEYILGDVDIPLRLDTSQQIDSGKWKSKYGSGLLSLSGESAYADLVFYLASCWGVRTSSARVGALELAIKKRLDKARGRLVRAGFVRGPGARGKAGTRNTKAASAYIAQRWARQGVEGKKTDKGAWSLDKDACTLSGSRLLELYSDYSAANTTLARVEDLKQGVDLPLQARFDTMLNTYRTSSSKPKPPVMGIQMQNFGKKDGTRETITPREGCVFIVADVSAMEAHYWAQFCLDMGWGSRLAELLTAGVDIHRALGELVYGKPAASLTDAERQLMKPGNYGFLGGMGADKFILVQRKDSGILYQKPFVEHLKRRWQEMVPESYEFFAHISHLCRRAPGTLRHPRTGAWRTADYCSLANFTFQHPSAIGVKRGLIAVAEHCYERKRSPAYGARLVNAIHDEGVWEIAEDKAADACHLIGDLFTAGVNTLLPDVPTTAPPLVTRAWSKRAKPVKVNGRFVPWTL